MENAPIDAQSLRQRHSQSLVDRAKKLESNVFEGESAVSSLYSPSEEAKPMILAKSKSPVLQQFEGQAFSDPVYIQAFTHNHVDQ